MESWRADALAHALREFPRESCGFVLADGRYWPCTNAAADDEHFVIGRADIEAVDAVGAVAGIVHSHPNAGCNPSPADRVACEASGMPWHIIALPSQRWGGCIPCGYEAPLIGRPFAHGVLDCYALIRDWYKRERGIELPNFFRADEWWRKGQNLYVSHFPEAGFRRVSINEARVGDVVLMQVLSNVPNHAAILIEPGVILHHMVDRASCAEVYGEYWRKHTTHFLRHQQCEP